VVSSTALKCSTILAGIRVVFVTRGALPVAEDGGRDNTPTSPFAPNFSKTFLRSRYEMPLPAIFSASCCLLGIPRLLDDKAFLGTSARVCSDDQGISCRFLRTVLLTCSLSTCPLKCSNGSQRLFFLKL